MTMCRLLNVPRNSYYYWMHYGDRQEDIHLSAFTKVIFAESFRTYGTRRIKGAIAKQYGWIVSRRRIARIMKQEGLKARNKQRFKPRTTNANHSYPIAPNLLNQDFYASSPNFMYTCIK